MTQSTPSPPHERRTRPVVTRFLARWLWSSTPDRSLAESIALQKRSYARAILIVRMYYVVSAYWVLAAVSLWPQYQQSKATDPLWPAHWWFEHVSLRTGVNLIFCAYLVASLVVVLLPQRRLARAAYALALLEYLAFVNTPDKINGDLQMWLFVAIILVLLPRGPWTEPRRVADRQYFLTVIWTATLVVLFFYSLSGAWKVHDAVFALAHGRNSGLNPSGFSFIVGQRILETNQNTVLGLFFTRNELPGWALFVGTMYLESASVIIAFRPRLHRVWGVALILFHLGTQLVMGFTFPQNIVLVGLLLVCSPFAPDRIDFKAAFLDLPVVHFIARRLTALHRQGDVDLTRVERTPATSPTS